MPENESSGQQKNQYSRDNTTNLYNPGPNKTVVEQDFLKGGISTVYVVENAKPLTQEQKAHEIVTSAMDTSTEILKELVLNKHRRSYLAHLTQKNEADLLPGGQIYEEIRFPKDASGKIEQIVLWTLSIAPGQLEVAEANLALGEYGKAALQIEKAVSLARGLIHQWFEIAENGGRKITSKDMPAQVLTREQVIEALKKLEGIFGVSGRHGNDNKRKLQQEFDAFDNSLTNMRYALRDKAVFAIAKRVLSPESPEESANTEPTSEIKEVPVITPEEKVKPNLPQFEEFIKTQYVEVVARKRSFLPMRKSEEIIVKVPGVDGNPPDEEVVEAVRAEFARKRVKNERHAERIMYQVLKSNHEMKVQKIVNNLIEALHNGKLGPGVIKALQLHLTDGSEVIANPNTRMVTDPEHPGEMKEEEYYIYDLSVPTDQPDYLKNRTEKQEQQDREDAIKYTEQAIGLHYLGKKITK